MSKAQIDILSDYIMGNIEDEPSKSEGAGDTAIRIIEQLQAENDMYFQLEDNNWDLRCEDAPTGGDDLDILWKVIEHYQTKPHDRVIGQGHTVKDALKQALKGGGK